MDSDRVGGGSYRVWIAPSFSGPVTRQDHSNSSALVTTKLPSYLRPAATRHIYCKAQHDSPLWLGTSMDEKYRREGRAGRVVCAGVGD